MRSAVLSRISLNPVYATGFEGFIYQLPVTSSRKEQSRVGALNLSSLKEVMLNTFYSGRVRHLGMVKIDQACDREVSFVQGLHDFVYI